MIDGPWVELTPAVTTGDSSLEGSSRNRSKIGERARPPMKLLIDRHPTLRGPTAVLRADQPGNRPPPGPG